MDEMIKRKKDSGFTLIELMIVIAVIGILAIVLVPKVGTIKTQAKATGLDTNVRLVEGYVQSKITKWADKSTLNTVIQADIIAAFDNDEISNPFTFSKEVDDASGDSALIVLTAADTLTTDKGAVVVAILGASTNVTGSTTTATTPVTSIKITAHDADGAIIAEKTVEIKP